MTMTEYQLDLGTLVTIFVVIMLIIHIIRTRND